MASVIMTEEHRRLMRRRTKWHFLFHSILLGLLTVSLAWPLLSIQKLDLVTEAYKFVKAEVNQYYVKDRLLKVFRTKNLTVAQAMDVCDTILAQKEIPVPLALALFEAESSFDPQAVSSKGAEGLGQLKGDVAKKYAGARVRDPITNVRGSLAHLADLKRDFNSWPKALRAYNGGRGNKDNKNLDGYVSTVMAKADKYEKEMR